MHKRIVQLITGALVFGWCVTAQAVLTIEITKGVEAGIPIAIVPFGGQANANPEHRIADIVRADLVRSGRFDSLPRKDFLATPHDDSQVHFKDWRLIKAEDLVVGKVAPAGNVNSVQFQLFDVFKGGQLAGYRYKVPNRFMRRVAHQISDIIYEKLTGEPGAFDTRIAYVTVETAKNKSRRYLLQVADSDGHTPKTILESHEPLMSPAWSPDGRRLAYVSFEKGRSMVYIQNIANGTRQQIASFQGINSAPAWAPDGKHLALVLSRDGNAEIYSMDLRTKALSRLTRNSAIDTEPTWSPDGSTIVFTSDRSGRPQLYRMNANGSDVRRLTFEGDYNARPDFSPDGKMITMVHAEKGRFHIAVLHLGNNALQVLTDAALDESPSFAPNGRMILYATEKQGRGVLSAISSDGRVQQTLKFQKGDVREPAWSPYSRKF
jgi:TolB protein